MDVDIEPISDDRLESYMAAVELAFSDRVHEADLRRERLIAMPDRYLAAYDGDRIVGGAASLPIEMTLPGDRRATCAFVTAVGWRSFERPRDEGSKPFHVIHRDREGRPDGYVVYTVKHEWPDTVAALQVEIRELIAETPDAYADLWRYVLDIDLVAEVNAFNRPADEPLLWLVSEPRRLRMRLGDALWIRLVDVPTALPLRGYAVPDRVVFDVQDRFCPWNEGRFELVVEPDGSSRCGSTDGDPDLACSVNDLGAVFLGGANFSRLWGAGQVHELTEGAIGRADAMFGTWPAPWSSFIL